MKHSIHTIGAAVVAAAIVLSGCTILTPPAATQAEINEELAELQALIPVLEAGLAVATAEEVTLTAASIAGRAGIQAVNAGAVFTGDLANSTPRQIFQNTAATPLGDGSVRFPFTAGAYLENFYGATGNEAEFYVSPYDDSDASAATIFRVKLYLYPTFSTTVNYVLEEYLVDADATSWALVDDNRNAAPLNYLTNRTVYFDGTVQEHTVVSNSVSNGGLFYDTLFDAGDSGYLDPANALYDYPAGSLPDPASDSGITGGTYSAKVVSTIAGTGETVVEYYTEIADGAGGIVKSALSYVAKNYVSGRFSETASTVRRYIEYADGTKIVRASTTSTSSFGGIDYNDRTIVESVDIGTNASTGLVEFTSTTSATDESGAVVYSTVVTLTETAAGSNAYSGTSIYTPAAGSDQSYTITLTDPVAGSGSMTIGGENTTVSIPVSRREAKDIVAELRNGGTFTGKLRGQILSGLYRALRSDDATSVDAALSFIYAITGSRVELQ